MCFVYIYIDSIWYNCWVEFGFRIYFNKNFCFIVFVIQFQQVLFINYKIINYWSIYKSIFKWGFNEYLDIENEEKLQIYICKYLVVFFC